MLDADRRRSLVADGGELRRELMAVFDQLPPALREAINYAPEALDPADLARLCRKHGAANVLAMIELKLARAAGGSPTPPQEKGRD
jgi:hypothetical protein